jgi:hypothetical membrane protein
LQWSKVSIINYDWALSQETNLSSKFEKMMKISTIYQRQLIAWAGIIGPFLFVAVFTLEGWLRPGYNPLSMYVSDLSLGPRGWIQMVNFVVFGVMLAVFTRSVAAEFQSGKASRGGLILLTIIAVSYFASGPFITDPMGTPLSQVSIHGTIHGIFGAIVFLLMPISCFVFLRRFRVDPQWQSFQWWTLALGTISAAGVVLLTLSTKFPNSQSVFKEWIGLIQRTAIVPFMIWLFIFAVELLRRSKQS